jgi:hypothetical protein
MSRRLATLAILLFSLFGAVPAVLACAALSGNTDCCTPAGSCDADPSQSLLTTSAACCAIQGTTQQARISIDTSNERLKPFSSSFDHPGVITTASLGLLTAAAWLADPALGRPCPYLKQQQTYLLTARLRL